MQPHSQLQRCLSAFSSYFLANYAFLEKYNLDRVIFSLGLRDCVSNNFETQKGNKRIILLPTSRITISFSKMFWFVIFFKKLHG